MWNTGAVLTACVLCHSPLAVDARSQQCTRVALMGFYAGLSCILGIVVSCGKRTDEAPQVLAPMLHLHPVGLLLQLTVLLSVTFATPRN
jgi:hypothetical protein